MDIIISLTRGDDLPKKNFDTTLHPSYELVVRRPQGSMDKKTGSLIIIKFFDQYRQLCNDILKTKLENAIEKEIRDSFPPSFHSSKLGLKLSEDALQQRSFMLNKWIIFIFKVFPSLREDAQKLVINFISNEKYDSSHPLIAYLLSFVNVSTGNEPSQTYNPSEEALANLSLRTIVADVLAVSVQKGPMLPKFPGDEKLHHSYETQVSILQLGEMSSAARSSVDFNIHSELLRRQGSGVAVSVCKVFDGYRSLRNELEAAGVLTVPPDDVDHNCQPVPGFIVRAHFPRTYLWSSVGVQVPQKELLQRVVLLNHWMGILLRDFRQLPRSAQNTLEHFLFSGSTTGNADMAPTVVAILKGEVANLQADEREGATKEISIAPIPNLLSGDQLQTTHQPTVLNNFATVHVVKSDVAVQKNDDDKRKHVAFTTTVRILPKDELSLELAMQKEQIFGDILFSCSVTSTFSAYRDLSNELENFDVFSKDRLKNSHDLNDCTIIDASFPETYAKSSVGMELSPSEINNRTMGLNYWMGKLLQHYARLSPPAKDLIHSFLRLELDDPAEPNLTSLIDILNGSFLPVIDNVLRTSHKGIMSRKFGSGTNLIDSSSSDHAKLESIDFVDHSNGFQSQSEVRGVEFVKNKGCNCRIM